MNYRFFTNSEKTWKNMFEAVAMAEKSIYLEMYIFQADMEKYDFFELLKKKAAQGLSVKLILDSFGSVGLSDQAIDELRGKGVEILFLSYLLHRTHRKILIVDESTAFIGGVNIYKAVRLWDDLMVRIKGALVKSLVRSFVKSYIKAGGKDQLLLEKKKRPTLNKVNVWLVEHSPVSKIFILKRIYRKYLNGAKKSIVLITPYFTPGRWLAAVLHQAVLRGVGVEILLPQKTDNFLIDRVNYFHMHRLSKLGIKFYLEPNMNHAKAMIIDNKDAMVGSQNLDFLSFDYNSEVGVFFEDPKIVAELLKIARTWKKDSVLFDYETNKPKWFDYALFPFIRLFFRIF